LSPFLRCELRSLHPLRTGRAAKVMAHYLDTAVFSAHRCQHIFRPISRWTEVVMCHLPLSLVCAALTSGFTCVCVGVFSPRLARAEAPRPHGNPSESWV
jgi:hypothetical protein